MTRINSNRQPNELKMVHNWLNIIQDYLLPPTCLLCGNKGFKSHDLCDICYQRLLRNKRSCYRCAEIFESNVSTPSLCGHCISTPPAFDETYAPFVYQAEMRHLVTQLKFGGHTKNARLLGLLLAEHLKQTAQLPELIIPVPLHKLRYRERGFNQALEIARTVAKELNIPLDITSCQRTHDTPHQIGLTAIQRRKNLEKAFTLIKPIKTQHVAILDDVMTTGSTVHEIASLLKKAGVERVDVWVCARA